MYSEYDSARHHTSSQDEDSGNFAYPSYRLGKRTSRLGKGGSRFKYTDFRTQILPESNDDHEVTNEDSNSITGPEGASVMSWLTGETPVKNDLPVKTSLSPPFAFRSINTINRSTGKHSEKPPINDFVGNIFPSFPETKPINPLSTSAPECKRSLTFKSTEQRATVLQNVINIDNIRKTPGSKAGMTHHSEKDRKITVDSASGKENFITNPFQTPNFGSFIDTDRNEPKNALNLYMRKPSESIPSANLTKITSNDIIVNSVNKKLSVDSDTRNDLEFAGYSSAGVHPLESSHNTDQHSKNFNDRFNLKIEDVKQVKIPVTSNSFPSFNNPNVVSNSYSGCLNDDFGKIDKPKSAIPFSSNSETVQDCVQIAHNLAPNKHSFGYPFVQSDIQPKKMYNDPFLYCKQNVNQETLNHPIKPVPSKASVYSDESGDSLNTVLAKPKKDIVPLVVEKKSIEHTDEKAILQGSTLSDVNIAIEVDHAQNKGSSVPSSTQNEPAKLTNSYALAVSKKSPVCVKSLPSSAQSDPMKKPIMAPPSTNLMKPPQGLVKPSRSTLLRTQSNSTSGIRFNNANNSKGGSSNEKIFVNNKSYEVLSTLGKGGSSEVFLVLETRSSELMAVKCVNLSQVDKVIADGYLNEVELLLKLQGCDSVIRMFDHEYVEDQKFLYVVMEKGDTDLSKLMRCISKTKNITMSMIIYYWTEMLSAVKDIHDKGIIHSDLKPANFLLVRGRLKLIDFGIASSLQGDMTSVHKEVTTGTWNYMSPEAIKNNGNANHGFKISYKSDVWSLGCILYNLIYGKTPFSHITSTWGKLMAIADPSHVIKFPDEMASGGKVPPIILETLKNCLTRDPKQRPSVNDLLNYEYYQSSNLNRSKLDCSVKDMNEDVAEQIKSILPLEYWGKICQLFGGTWIFIPKLTVENSTVEIDEILAGLNNFRHSYQKT